MAGLGIGSCGHLVCAGDLHYAIDASGQHMCEWKCPKNSMPAEIASMGLSSENLNELKRLAPQLEAASFDPFVVNQDFWVVAFLGSPPFGKFYRLMDPHVSLPFPNTPCFL